MKWPLFLKIENSKSKKYASNLRKLTPSCIIAEKTWRERFGGKVLLVLLRTKKERNELNNLNEYLSRGHASKKAWIAVYIDENSSIE